MVRLPPRGRVVTARSVPASSAECTELRRLLARADENALILEAVNSTLQDLDRNLRNAATAAADPGTYTAVGATPKRSSRHVLAACINASV